MCFTVRARHQSALLNTSSYCRPMVNNYLGSTQPTVHNLRNTTYGAQLTVHNLRCTFYYAQPTALNLLCTTQARVQEFVRGGGGGGPKSESLFFCFSIFQGKIAQKAQKIAEKKIFSTKTVAKYR